MFGRESHFSDPSPDDGADDRAHWAMGGGRGPRGPRGHEGGGSGLSGFGRGGFPFRRFHAGPRARRGDIRAAILALLAEQPRNGYQIMQELAERTNGMWRPSSGSVYPTFQQLEDEGLVSLVSSGSGRNYQLTDKGQAYVKAHPDEVTAPWESMGGDAREQMGEFRALVVEVVSAVRQVMASGTGAQVADARKILKNTRKALYHLLADDKED